jgi:predicted dehydrogenase
MKIAVAGFGFMGLTHTLNILKNPNLELTGIVDKVPENIRKNLTGNIGNFSTGDIDEKMLSNVSIYKGLEECLHSERPDAVVISVHTDMHFPLTMMALNAGVSVFLEKPFSLSVSEAGQMIELAARKKLTLMIGHVVRFMPPYQKLRNWILSDEYGKLEFLSLSRFSGLPAWGQWKEKRIAYGSTGGALFDLLIHDIDYAQWVLGQPDTVESFCLPGELSDYDYVDARWVYNAGPAVKIEGGNIFHTSFPFSAGFIARFENASIKYSSAAPLNILVSTHDETISVPAGDAGEGFSGEIDYFARCIMTNSPPELCTPESAMKTIELCYRHIGK